MMCVWEGPAVPEGWCWFSILATVGLPSRESLCWVTTLPKTPELQMEAWGFGRFCGS